jgi:hypothetical protein
MQTRGREDEERLVADMIELTRQFGRYGYRRDAALLRDARWQVNDKRVERLWKREGLKVPMKQARRGRPWLNPSRGLGLIPLGVLLRNALSGREWFLCSAQART